MSVTRSRDIPAAACSLVEPVRPSIVFAESTEDEEDDDEETADEMAESDEDETDGGETAEDADGEAPETDDEDGEEEQSAAAGSSFSMSPVVSGRVILGHWYWGNLAIDLEGIEAVDRSIPVLMGHDHERRVGFTTRVEVEPGVGLVAEGRTLSSSPHAAEVRAAAEDGFPWQASAHVVPLSIENVEAGVTVAVNGQVLTGPGTVFRRSAIREVSFVSVGADPNTNAATFAAAPQATTYHVAHSHMTKKTNPAAVELSADSVRSDHPTVAAELRGEGIAQGEARERERVSAILSAAAPEQHDLAVELIREGVRLSDAQTRINTDLRERLAAARSQFHSSDPALGAVRPAESAATGGAQTGTDLEAQIAREWDRDALLREEFGGDRATFAAYRRAELSGRITKVSKAS